MSADKISLPEFQPLQVAEDLDRAAMTRLLRRFRQKVAPGDDVVVFYAGHGVEVDVAGWDAGENEFLGK